MNNSPICTFSYNGQLRYKKKYKTAQEAHNAAKTINKLPQTIHVFGEYKCTTCLMFHIGKTKKLIQKDNDIFDTKIKSDQPVALPAMKANPVNDVWAQNKSTTVEPMEPSDDFNWDQNDKSIKKVDSVYESMLFRNKSII